MFYFASVVTLCEDPISYRLDIYKDILQEMAEDYESHQDRSQYNREMPYNSCLEFWRQPAYSILRDKDKPSLNLEVRFPRAIISYAKSKEDREMPWEYRWNNNLTGYNISKPFVSDSVSRQTPCCLSGRVWRTFKEVDCNMFETCQALLVSGGFKLLGGICFG